MKRIVSLLLVLMLSLPIVGGTALAEKAPVELDIVVVRRATDITKSFSEKHWVQQAEKACNVKINWIELMEGAVDEPLAAILAGDLPDAFFMGMQFPNEIITQNTGLFHTLTVEEIKEFAPNIYALYEKYVPDWKQVLTYPNGNIYGLLSGGLSSENHLTQGLQYLNYQWLENLGLEIPTNLNEFHDMLVAFRDKDANGNGDPNDEIPLDFCNNHYAANILNFASAWGLAIGNGSTFYNIDNGIAVPTVNTNAFREFLEYFHQLGQEGLLNLEGFSQTQDQYNANLDALKVGVFWGWGPYNYIKSDARLQYKALVPIAADGYSTSILANNPNRSNTNGFVITKDCENVEAALRFYDYLSEPTMALNVANGEEGVFWNMVDENYNYTTTDGKATDEALIAAGYDNLVGVEFNGGNTVGYVNNAPLTLKAPTYDIEANPTANSVIRLVAMRAYTSAGVLSETIPKVIVPAEAKEELDFMCDGLQELINGFTAESIINGVTDASWSNFCEKLEQYNYGFYIEWYNKLCRGEL